VCIGIVQAFEYTNPLVQMSIACDVFFCMETLHASNLLPRLVDAISIKMSILKTRDSKASYQMDRPSGGKNRVAFAPSPFALSSTAASSSSSSSSSKDSSLGAPQASVWVSLLRAAAPLLLPALAQMGGGSDLVQAWLTLPRLLRLKDLVAIYHTLKFKFTDLAALRNDTINRCFMTAVFTSIYASSLAAIWFYLSCRHTQQCSSAEDDDGGGGGDSWVGRDEVLRQQDSFSIYIRSLHFVIQTLFTVGYGE